MASFGFSSRQNPILIPFTVSQLVVTEQPLLKQIRYLITGITKDSTGAALDGCSISVFECSTLTNGEPKKRLVNTTISDSLGNYSIEVHSGIGMTFQCVAYKAGGTDVAGITVNTLVGTAT